jgi:hypothetical protein
MQCKIFDYKFVTCISELIYEVNSPVCYYKLVDTSFNDNIRTTQVDWGAFIETKQPQK